MIQVLGCLWKSLQYEILKSEKRKGYYEFFDLNAVFLHEMYVWSLKFNTDIFSFEREKSG